MKRILLLLVVLMNGLILKAQGLNENFNYSVGSLVTNSSGTWTNVSTSSGTDFNVVNSNLTYANYLNGAGTGKSVSISATGTEDVKTTFTAATGVGTTLYSSFLINVSSSATSSAYIAHYLSGVLTSHKCRVFASGTNSNTKFRLGIARGDNTVNWDPINTTNLTFGQTYLVVMGYSFSADDQYTVSLWINPAITSTVPTPNISFTGSDVGYSSIDAFSLRQAGTIAGVNATLDGLRIATSWIDVVLPIKLSSFTASKQGEKSKLNWATATEKNNSHFEILRSTDGQSFQPIATVKGNRNSDEKISYSYTDFFPAAGTNYYQLNQVDIDGKSEKSNVTAVTFASLNDLSFYTYKIKEGEVGVKIFSPIAASSKFVITDLQGRKLVDKELSLVEGQNMQSVQLNGAEKGLFIANLTYIGKRYSYKFIN